MEQKSAPQSPGGIESENLKEMSSPFDPRFLLESVENDEKMFDHLLKLFQLDYPTRREKVEQAMVNNSSKDLFEAAHYLRGELLTLGRTVSSEIAEKLESAARTQNLKNVKALVVALDKSIQPVLDYIKTR